MDIFEIWRLPNGGLEDHVDDRDGDRVACDLEAIRSEFLPKLDPKEELLKRISLKHVDRPKPKRLQFSSLTQGSESFKSLVISV